MKMKFPMNLFSSRKLPSETTIVPNVPNLQPPVSSPITIGYWSWDLSTNRSFFSDSLYAILDVEPHRRRMTADDAMDMIHPDDRQMVRELFTYIQAYQVRVREFEARIITESDKVKFLVTRVEAAFDEEGTTESLRAVVEDVTAYRNAMKQWSFTKRSFDAFVANSSDAIVFLDTKLRITQINAAAEQLFGWSEKECIGLRIPMVPPSEQIQVIQMTKELIGKKSIPSHEALRQCKDGSLIDVSVSMALITDDYDEPVGIAIVYRDIRERVNLNQQLHDQEDRLDKLMLQSIDVVVTLNGSQAITYVSPSVQHILGYQPNELLGIDFYILVHPDDGSAYTTFVGDICTAMLDTRIELRLRHKEHQWKSFSLAGHARHDNHGHTEFIFHFYDVTEEKELRASADRQTTHDQVTGLANHAFLEAYIANLCAQKDDASFAFLRVEVKDFRSLFGGLETHLIDEFVRAIANRIQNLLPANSFLGRINDVQFGIVLPYHNVFYIEQLAERLTEAFSQMIHVDRHQVLIPCSIGICLRNQPTMEAKTVWKNAGYALTMVHHRKTHKRHFVYTSNLDLHAFKYHQLSEDLSSAIENNQFEVYYQPRVNGRTGEILGAEALIRWNHPQWGIVLPGDFIPQAEATGFIEKIGEWVLKTACQQMAEWHLMGFPGLGISVNFSPRQFLERDVETMIAHTLHQSHLNPAYLEIEVTENGYSDIPSIATSLAKLKSELGLTVAIDDFGTGEASLLVLRELDPDVIKIDRSLIADIAENPKSLSIVHAVQQLALALDYTVIVEGVERQAQVEKLLEQGCLYMQGYYFSEPLPADSFTQALTLRRIQSPMVNMRDKKDWVSRTHRINFPHPLSGQVTLHSIGGQVVDLGYSPIAIRNMSISGMAFDASIRFSRSNDLSLKFLVKIGRRTFKFIGQIMRVEEIATHKYRYGVEFSEYDQIDELITSLDQLEALLLLNETPAKYEWLIEG